ncbi:MAG: AAA family ATPase [Planctomycetota bacterium]|nr:AAA family ATPase [Planctomycetota bacterium]
MTKNSGLAELGQEFLRKVETLAHRVEPSSAGTDEIGFIDTATFLDRDYPLNWLIKQILVEGQPCILGGGKKNLKTNLAIALAVALSGGLPFLGRFPVPRRLRVGVISGESGGATIKETFRRICKAASVDPQSLGVFWSFRLPHLSKSADVQELAVAIEEHGLDVIILDPLYLSLLAGNPNVQASNIYQMGPLLGEVTQACLEAGATPVLVHHTKMDNKPTYQPPELENLAFAGVQEFARQWILVGRREKYEPGTGEHRLWLNVGSAVGFSGCWALDIGEGMVQDDFTGRRWDVSVSTAAVEREARAQRREEEKASKEQRQLAQDCGKIRDVLRSRSEGETRSVLSDGSGISKGRVLRALEIMRQRGQVETCEVVKGAGKGGDRNYDGYRLVEPEADKIDDDDRECEEDED